MNYVFFAMIIAVYIGLASYLLQNALKTQLLAYYLFSFSMVLKGTAMLIVLFGEMKLGGGDVTDYVFAFYFLTTISIGLFWWGIDWLRSVSLSLWQFFVVILTLLLLLTESVGNESKNLFSSEELRGILAGILLFAVFGRIVISDIFFLVREKGSRIALEVLVSYRAYQGLILYLVFLVFARPYAMLINPGGLSPEMQRNGLYPWIMMAIYWLIPVGFILLSVVNDPTGLLDPKLVSDIFVSSESGKLRFTLAKSDLAPDPLQNNLLTAIGLAVKELYNEAYYALTTSAINLVAVFLGNFLVTFATSHKLRSPWNFIKTIRIAESQFKKKKLEGLKDVEDLVEFFEYLFPAIVFGKYRTVK